MNIYLLHESGLIDKFDELQIIADTRKNAAIKRDMNMIIESLMFSVTEILEQAERPNKYKNLYEQEKEFVIQICMDNGLDVNMLRNLHEMNKSTELMLRQVDKTFSDGMKKMEAMHPELFRKVFDEN